MLTTGISPTCHACVCAYVVRRWSGNKTEHSVPKKKMTDICTRCRRFTFKSDLIAEKKFSHVEKRRCSIHGKTNDNINKALRAKNKSNTWFLKPPNAKNEFKCTHVGDASHTRSFSSGAQKGRGCRQSALLCTYLQKRNTMFPLPLHLLPAHPHHLRPSPMTH